MLLAKFHVLTATAAAGALLALGAHRVPVAQPAPSVAARTANVLLAPAVAATGKLTTLTVGIVAGDGFDEPELVSARQALAGAAARTLIVSGSSTELQGYRDASKADLLKVEATFDQASRETLDALLLVGRTAGVGPLPMPELSATRFVRDFVGTGKPIAASGDALELLASANALRGRMVTSPLALRGELQAAGATWVDQSVLLDGNMLTSRGGGASRAFDSQALLLFAESHSLARP